MRIGYFVAALLSITSVAVTIFCVSSPRWIVSMNDKNQRTNFGLWVYQSCTGNGPTQDCYFKFYNKHKGSWSYPYYKAGTVGGAFMILGGILSLIFTVFMFIKSSSGMAGKCMHRVINHYYMLYYLGLVAVFCTSLGWGLFFHYVPHDYPMKYPFWLMLANWLVMLAVVIAIFLRKIAMGNAKKGGWMSLQ